MKVLEFFRTVNKLNFPADEFYILGGGTLLFFGIKSETKDIDLCISTEIFNILKRQNKVDMSSKNKYGFYKLIEFPNVEVIPNDKKEFNCVKLGDLYFEDLNQILEFKKVRNLKKDVKAIEDIENFLIMHPEYKK